MEHFDTLEMNIPIDLIFLKHFIYYIYTQILTELEHSGLGRNKEQAARMLGHLVSRAPRLIRPYMEPILKVWKKSIIWDG